jgi:hypothetical protein
MTPTKPLSVVSEFKKVALPKFGDYGFIEYSGKRFGAISPDGILISIHLIVETHDIRRFKLELGACNIYEAHDFLPLTIGGSFPHFDRGETYNARDAEILARSLAYVVQHLEKGTKDWMRRVFSLPGYLAELRSLEKTHPYLWKTQSALESFVSGRNMKRSPSFSRRRNVLLKCMLAMPWLNGPRTARRSAVLTSCSPRTEHRKRYQPDCSPIRDIP